MSKKKSSTVDGEAVAADRYTDAGYDRMAGPIENLMWEIETFGNCLNSSKVYYELATDHTTLDSIIRCKGLDLEAAEVAAALACSNEFFNDDLLSISADFVREKIATVELRGWAEAHVEAKQEALKLLDLATSPGDRDEVWVEKVSKALQTLLTRESEGEGLMIWQGVAETVLQYELALKVSDVPFAAVHRLFVRRLARGLNQFDLSDGDNTTVRAFIEALCTNADKALARRTQPAKAQGELSASQIPLPVISAVMRMIADSYEHNEETLPDNHVNAICDGNGLALVARYEARILLEAGVAESDLLALFDEVAEAAIMSEPMSPEAVRDLAHLRFIEGQGVEGTELGVGACESERYYITNVRRRHEHPAIQCVAAIAERATWSRDGKACGVPMRWAYGECAHDIAVALKEPARSDFITKLRALKPLPSSEAQFLAAAE